MSTIIEEKALGENLKEVFGLINQTLEKSNENSAEMIATMKTLNDRADAFEDEKESIRKAREDEKSSFEKRLAEIETQTKDGARLPGGKAIEDIHAEHKKATDLFLRFGDKQASLENTAVVNKYFNTQTDTGAAFLIAPQLASTIDKLIVETSPVQQFARNINTSSNEFRQPVRTQINTAYWVGEGQGSTQSQSVYKQVILNPYSIAVQIEVTQEMLDDTAFNLEQQFAEDTAISFALQEGNSFILGSGVQKPTGMITASAFNNAVSPVTVLNSENANGFTAINLMQLQAQLKPGYKGVWAFAKETRGYIRALTNPLGQFVWEPGIEVGDPSRILGDAYSIWQDVPQVAANNIPVIYGDYNRGYTITHRPGITLVRDPYTKGDQRIIIFRAFKRTGGNVVAGEAIKALKCAISS